MQPKSNNPFLSFLKEIAIIVIGVLIAVSINKLKEDYDNKKYVTKTLTTIQKEIDFSKQDVEKVLVRHELLVDSLWVNIDNEKTLSEIIFGLGGIQAPETKNIGLRFFVANKADLVEYEMISQLSNIESAANLLDEKMKRMVDFMFIYIDKNDRSSKEKFIYHLNNVINSEEDLVELYTALAKTKR